jgi:hypothetical protein
MEQAEKTAMLFTRDGDQVGSRATTMRRVAPHILGVAAAAGRAVARVLAGGQGLQHNGWRGLT